jgi:arabinan endo-1,5-alpha-L-arabinosidase
MSSSSRFHRLRVAASAVCLCAASVTVMVTGAAPSQAATIPQPVSTASMPDPGAVLNGDQFLAFTTGTGLQESTSATAGGPWTAPVNELAALPPWTNNSAIWAPDVIHVDNGWIVYFSAVVTAKSGATKPDSGARCIGVAVSTTSPTGPFTAEAQPLVCLPGYGAADDMSGDPANRVTDAGAIDPSPAYVTISGQKQLFLLYKTQELPATIRMVRLAVTDGETVLGDSHQLLYSIKPAGGYTFADTIEAPSLIQQGSYFILFVAHGNYGLCSYSTQWFKSQHIWSWTNTGGVSLLTSSGTGLCGPAGADVTGSEVAGQDRLFFHSWACSGTKPCASGATDTGSRRLMYSAVLTWGSNGFTPVIPSFITPGS